MFKKSTPVAWECQVCGHIHYGVTAPAVCPVCKHPKGYFITTEEEFIPQN